MGFAEKLKSLFGLKPKVDFEFFEELTDILIEGDISAKTAYNISTELESICRAQKISDHDSVSQKLKEILLSYIKTVRLEPDFNKVNIFMVLGVNGVGKTTTAAKIANLYANKYGKEKIVLAAADTFRAAAIEQLQIHGKNLGIRVVAHQSGSDPAAVVFDAASAVQASGGGLVIADTAGRLHNKENLVNELKKIDRIASTKASPDSYKKILVVDSTTGQNALRQAEVFHQAVGLDSIVLTKCESSAKGGAAFTIGKELGVPVSYICTGEKYLDIKEIDAQEYTDKFVTNR